MKKSETNSAAIKYYIEKGAIERHADFSAKAGEDVYVTTDKGRAWVVAICNTPAPTAVWVDQNGKQILP